MGILDVFDVLGTRTNFNVKQFIWGKNGFIYVLVPRVYFSWTNMSKIFCDPSPPWFGQVGMDFSFERSPRHHGTAPLKESVGAQALLRQAIRSFTWKRTNLPDERTLTCRRNSFSTSKKGSYIAYRPLKFPFLIVCWKLVTNNPWEKDWKELNTSWEKQLDGWEWAASFSHWTQVCSVSPLKVLVFCGKLKQSLTEEAFQSLVWKHCLVNIHLQSIWICNGYFQSNLQEAYLVDI